MPRKGAKKARTRAGPSGSLAKIQDISEAKPAEFDDPLVPLSHVPWIQLPEGPLLRVMEVLFFDKDGKAAVCSTALLC